MKGKWDLESKLQEGRRERIHCIQTMPVVGPRGGEGKRQDKEQPANNAMLWIEDRKLK